MQDYYLLVLEKDIFNSTLRDSPRKLDLSESCKTCGTGWKKSFLEVNKLPNSDLSKTMLEDFIISEKLFNYLSNNGIDLSNLSKIQLKGVEVDYYWLKGQYGLSPMDLNKSKGIIIDNQCENCHRNGFFDTLKEDPMYFYSFTEFEKNCKYDIFNTWEHFGASILTPSGNRVFKMSRPRIIISSKVYEILSRYQFKNDLNVKFHKVIIHSD